MPNFTIVDFFKYIAAPGGGALLVLYVMKEVVVLANLAPGIKRLVGIALCLLVSAVAWGGLFLLKVISVIDANTIFQVFMEAFLIAQSLQLLTAPSPDPALVARGIKPVAKLRGFGWW